MAGTEPAGTQQLGTIDFYGTVGTQNMSGAGNYTNIGSLSLEHKGSGVSISNAMVVNRVNLFQGSLDPTNLTIGRSSTASVVQIGGTATVAPGTFTAVPTFDYTSGTRTNYLYAVCNTTMTTGAYNELCTRQ